MFINLYRRPLRSTREKGGCCFIEEHEIFTLHKNKKLRKDFVQNSVHIKNDFTQFRRTE